MSGISGTVKYSKTEIYHSSKIWKMKIPEESRPAQSVIDRSIAPCGRWPGTRSKANIHC